MHRRPRLLPLILALLVLLTACGQPGGTAAAPSAGTTPVEAAGGDVSGEGSSGQPSAEPSVRQGSDPSVPSGEVLQVREIGRRPHDPTAFTQGLEFDGGRLFESRGLYAADEPVTLTEIDPADGTTIREVQRDAADGDYFAEGLTVLDDRIIQITWRSGVARVYDRDTFAPLEQHTYEGEGWGICDEPDRLVMSDGTSTLTFRDRDTFQALGTVEVDLSAYPNDDLNELECVDGLVWANLWNTNTILVIDPGDGAVVSEVDVSVLAGQRGRPADGGTGDVLNGIAYDPLSGTWLLTGKQWAWMFEVAFDCVQGCGTTVTPSHYVRPRPATATAGT